MGCQMSITFYEEVEAKECEGSSKLKIRWLNNEGSNIFAVRRIQIKPGGYSPYHSHPWEHEIFVLEGSSTAVGEKVANSIRCWRPYFYSSWRNPSNKEHWQKYT
jgi:hypothetical protein